MKNTMTRSEFLKLLGMTGAGLALRGYYGEAAAALAGGIKRPNIVYVFPDEFRQQAIGFMKQEPVITPHLDRFASEGIVLTNAVSNNPVCSPYRAMLMTGKYSIRNQVINNCTRTNAQNGNYLHEDERCVSDVLHDAGYSLGYIAKLHLDTPNVPPDLYPKVNEMDAYTPPGPRRHGFDFWYSYGCDGNHLHPHYWTGNAKMNELTWADEWAVKHETDVAINFIRNKDGRHRDPAKPFALFVAHHPPHMPFRFVPPEYQEIYKNKPWHELLTRPNVNLAGWTEKQKDRIKTDFVRNYFAAITGIDENFGRLLECLKQEGLDKDTIVIFTSDHGEMMGSHGRMYKDIWYDEAFLVPFIVRWPGHLRPRTDDLLLSAPDVMPTLLGLAGLGRNIPAGVEGVDYSDLLLGKETIARPDSALYYQEDKRGVRTHRYTFAMETECKKKSGQIVINDGRFGREVLHLYDNQNDPYQLNNIVLEEPGIARELGARMKSWCEKIGAPHVDIFDDYLQKALKQAGI